MQSVSPSSITAWLKSPGAPDAETAGRSRAASAARTFGSSGSSGSAPRRARTRATLPSTTGTGSPKQMLATAAAV